MVTDCKVMTVIVVELEKFPKVAPIVVDPADHADARPEALMVATPEFDEVQDTVLVRFCLDPSEYLPLAVNCCVARAMTVGFTGLTTIESSTGAVTANCAVPLTELRDAVMVTGPPAATPLASPLLDIVAMLVFDEDHVTKELTVWFEPSE